MIWFIYNTSPVPSPPLTFLLIFLHFSSFLPSIQLSLLPSFTQSFIPSFIYSFLHLLNRLFLPFFIHSFIHSFHISSGSSSDLCYSVSILYSDQFQTPVAVIYSPIPVPIYLSTLIVLFLFPPSPHPYSESK